jgi:tight adherence protein C
MPDVLDLMTVSVEAGLGFDAALLRITERMEGPLVEEFRVVMHEMRIGETRAKALKSFADRIDAPESSTLARAITQADQLGVPIGRILRVQAKEIRLRREMAAEEQAMKAPVKMLIPTALFIFPAVFVVILGPAAIALAETFG